MERKGELTAFSFEYFFSVSAEVVWAAGLRHLCGAQNLPVHSLGMPESLGTWHIQSSHVNAEINFPQFKMSCS